MIPLWVADVDFASPKPVIDALRERAEHGIFGYGLEPPALRAVIVERLERLYGWQITPEDLAKLSAAKKKVWNEYMVPAITHAEEFERLIAGHTYWE